MRENRLGSTPESKGLARPVEVPDPETQLSAKKIAHRGIWVEPSQLAEIGYRTKSAEGRVRHPVFNGLR